MIATIYSKGKGRTHDLIFALGNRFFVNFYNKNSTKLIPSHSLHHKVPGTHVVNWWHLGKCIKFRENRTNIKSSTHHPCQPWRLPHQGRNITKICLSPTHTHLFLVLSLVAMQHWHISLHADWSSSSTIHYIFTMIIWYPIFLHLLLSHAPQWGKRSGILTKHCWIFL